MWTNILKIRHTKAAVANVDGTVNEHLSSVHKTVSAARA
jgi:hypothetical protein